MSQMNCEEVEKWLCQHPSFSVNYIERGMSMLTVNKWLLERGHESIEQRPTGNLGRALLKRTPSIINNFTRPSTSQSKDEEEKRIEDPNLSAIAEYQLLGRSFKKMDLMEKILKFELDGDYKFFLSIIQDLATVSNVKELSQQVANNVFIFLEASGASIFVLRKSNGVEIVSKKIEKKSLKVISERNDLSTLMNQINISLNSEGKPWSEKVCDYVASTGDVVNLQIPSEDFRFDERIDGVIKHNTDSFLCLPIMNGMEEIIAVVQVVNKNDNNFFTKSDEKICRKYLKFVGIFLSNMLSMDTLLLKYGESGSKE